MTPADETLRSLLERPPVAYSDLPPGPYCTLVNGIGGITAHGGLVEIWDIQGESGFSIRSRHPQPSGVASVMEFDITRSGAETLFSLLAAKLFPGEPSADHSTAFPDIPPDCRRRVAHIIRLVCEAHVVTPAELEGQGQCARVARPRQLAMAVIRAACQNLTLEQIARFFRRTAPAAHMAVKAVASKSDASAERDRILALIP